MAPLFCYWEHICACGHHVKLYWESHPGVMIYDQIEPVEFFFFSLSLGWHCHLLILNSASFLWSPPFCCALRGSWGGDTHAHDRITVTGGMPTFTLLHRHDGVPPGSQNGDWSAARCYSLLNGEVGRSPARPTSFRNQWGLTEQSMNASDIFLELLSPWLQKSSFITLAY